MWYEMIPPLIIIGMVPIIHQWTAYYANKYFLGNPMRRDMCQLWDRHMFTRDARISGAPWKHKGLEDVPDE